MDSFRIHSLGKYTDSNFPQLFIAPEFGLELAPNQLSEMFLRIIEIAANRGFRNDSCFTSPFAKKYGIIAIKYRKDRRCK